MKVQAGSAPPPLLFKRDTDVCAAAKNTFSSLRPSAGRGSRLLFWHFRPSQRASLHSSHRGLGLSVMLPTCRLWARWDVGQTQRSHPRTPALPHVPSAHFHKMR